MSTREYILETADDTGLVTPPVEYTLDEVKLPTAEWEMVTPVMAHEALAHMRKNRKLRETKVAAITEDILNRKWRLTGETVQQGDDGLWDNGQHRFTAIYRASVAVPVLVVRGVPEDARIVIDTGSPRRFGDVLLMHGERNANGLGALVRRMYMWDTYGAYMLQGGGQAAPSHQTLDAYRAQHVEEIAAALPMRDYAKRCWLSPTVLATVHVLLRRIDKEDAARFLEGVITGAELKFTDPRRVLRDKLRDLHESGDATPDETRAWVMLAWNHYRSGNEITRLLPPRGGTTRHPFTAKNYPLPIS